MRRTHAVAGSTVYVRSSMQLSLIKRTSVIRNVVGRLGDEDGPSSPLDVVACRSGKTAEGEDRNASGSD